VATLTDAKETRPGALAAILRRRPRWPPGVGDIDEWWPDACALLAAGVALALALLTPRLLPDTDPFGVDPYSLRLAAVGLALLVCAAAVPRLRGALAVLVAVASVVLPFVLWASTVDLWARTVVPLGDGIGKDLRLGYLSGVVAQDAAYLAATLVIAAGAVGLARAQHRPAPALRLLSYRPSAVAITVGLVLAMALVTLAIPATLLGRVALPLARLRSDMPMFGPAFALQGAAQELAFRGVLLGTLERSMPAWLANWSQAMLFGLAHIAVMYEGPAASIVPVTILLGVALGWVTQKTGSIWPAVVVHAVIEIGQGYLVLPGLYGF
jgi:membrane protease YdiL (CAAX protease family)